MASKKFTLLKGRWLGVKTGFHFDITDVTPEGNLSGRIWLEQEETPTNVYPLAGRYDEKSKTWGFVVTWANVDNTFDSSTSYILSPLADPYAEYMKCYWLKRDLTEDYDQWENTTLGNNYFYRELLTKDQKKHDELAPFLKSGCSHPTKLLQKPK